MITWYLLNNINHISENEISVDVIVPQDSPWFCGHFPGDPVLPGIAQLGIAFDIAEQLRNVKLTGIKRVRFKKLIRPDDILNIKAVISEEKSLSCSFKIMVKEEIACSGIFIIEEKINNESR